jgi:hypothetical protein
LNIPKTLLVDIRQAFTISVVNNSDLFVKKETYSSGFQRENQNTIKNFFHKNRKYLLSNKYLIVKDSSTFFRSRHIALSFSRYGGNGCGNYNEDFLKKIDWVSNGGGCCSDHSMVFIGLCLINNIEAREVSNISHTFNEFWDPEKQKWIFIDPEYLVMAKDSYGNYLSTFEIYQAQKNGLNLTLDFFGSENENIKSIASNYASPSNFKCILLKMQNNVFTEEKWNKVLFFLPKELRQFVFITIGFQKGYIAIDENSDYILDLKKRKLMYELFCGIYLIINFIAILYLSISKRFNV